MIDGVDAKEVRVETGKCATQLTIVHYGTMQHANMFAAAQFILPGIINGAKVGRSDQIDGEAAPARLPKASGVGPAKRALTCRSSPSR